MASRVFSICVLYNSIYLYKCGLLHVFHRNWTTGNKKSTGCWTDSCKTPLQNGKSYQISRKQKLTEKFYLKKVKNFFSSRRYGWTSVWVHLRSVFAVEMPEIICLCTRFKGDYFSVWFLDRINSMIFASVRSSLWWCETCWCVQLSDGRTAMSDTSVAPVLKPY